MGSADGNSRQRLEPGVDSSTTAGAACAMPMPSVFLGAAILFIAGWWLASGRAGAGTPAAGRSAGRRDRRAVPHCGRSRRRGRRHSSRSAGSCWRWRMVPLAIGAHRADRGMRRNDGSSPSRDRRLCGRARSSSGVDWPSRSRGQASGVAPLGARRGDPADPRAGGRRAHPARRVARRGGVERPRSSSRPSSRSPARRRSSRSPPTRRPYLFPLRALDRARSSWPGGSRSGRWPGSRPGPQLQRDLVVAATEAERARVAADIHDDALQELTLLVQRLDAAGDTEGADIARTVSDRLRAICGDLRLPILDDLGVGPALDWLVLRIERLAGGEVRLERADGTRPPADVELAFFRVAQEALANAVKHGSRRSSCATRRPTSGASLSIDDAGPGIEPDAGDGGRARRPLRPAQHAAAGRGDRRDPRRPPLAGRRHPRRARMAGALIGGSAASRDDPCRRSSTTTRWSGEGTAALLRAQPDLEVVGVAASLEAARDGGLTDRDRGRRPAARHPARHGQRAPAPVRRRRPRRGAAPAVIVLTAYDYPQYAEAALRLGAAGFVLKTAPTPRAGRRDPAGRRRRARVRGPAADVRSRRLTAREHDVVRLVADGRSNDEIGATLGIGSKTVETAPVPHVRTLRRLLPHRARGAGRPRGLAGRAARRLTADLRTPGRPTGPITRRLRWCRAEPRLPAPAARDRAVAAPRTRPTRSRRPTSPRPTSSRRPASAGSISSRRGPPTATGSRRISTSTRSTTRTSTRATTGPSSTSTTTTSSSSSSSRCSRRKPGGS